MALRPTMLPTRDDLVLGARLFVNCVRLLREPLDAPSIYAEYAAQLGQREGNFLRLVRAIYTSPGSPYQRLLALAGCEPGDVERLVRREGLEGALHQLFRHGVYLTADESRGQRPVVRGSVSFVVDPRQLQNPRVVADLMTRTGGSRGPRTAIPGELRSVREDVFPGMDRSDGTDVQAIGAVPGAGALRWLIQHALAGVPPERWFSPLDPQASELHPRYLWSTRAVQAAGLMAGVRLPAPEYVPLADPMPIAHWMSVALAAGRSPWLHTYVTTAVRVCMAARAAGVDLTGASFQVTGEPTTAARLAAIERVGARVVSRYASTELGAMGRGCLAPVFPDETHLFTERLALIQPGDTAVPDLPARALLFTTLAPRAKLQLLNASAGDQAEVFQRDCGCSYERCGWTTHLHTIRSFEKLTAGGMTFFDADVVRALEEELPARFGGGPTDYQLVDEEGVDGAPGVHLLVHPRLGALDAAEVRQTFLDAVGGGSGVERVMALAWREGGLPVVKRQPPLETPTGKIRHVHRVTR